MFHFPQTFSGVTELRAEERAFSVGALELFKDPRWITTHMNSLKHVKRLFYTVNTMLQAVTLKYLMTMTLF